MTYINHLSFDTCHRLHDFAPFWVGDLETFGPFVVSLVTFRTIIILPLSNVTMTAKGVKGFRQQS